MLITKRIVGIAPEIRFYSLREAPGAIAYELWSNSATLTVRASGLIADAEHAVQVVWPKYFPSSVLEMSSAKDIYAANYADDARLARLLAISTALAIIIAAFGQYVLAADAVQRRTREIALRKLFGAGRLDIGSLIARQVGAIVLLSALVALPLTALAIARYLAVFTEQTPLALKSTPKRAASAARLLSIVQNSVPLVSKTDASNATSIAPHPLSYNFLFLTRASISSVVAMTDC